jgi:hypothetical protein
MSKKITNHILGLSEADDNMINDILHGRVFMNDLERQLAAWRAFLAMDLDSMLKRATGLDNMEKFKRTWKDSDQWDEPDTDERARYEEDMYPALAIYYPIEERNTDVYFQLRGRVQKEVNEKLRELGFEQKTLGWIPQTGKDISGHIRSHIYHYIQGWVSYHSLGSYEAMEVLYR